MLLFAKAAVSREPDANQLLHSANVKYDTFIDATELREKVRRALGNHLLAQIQGDAEESFRPGDRLAQLRAYSRTYTSVKISPMVPACQYNSFRVKNVESGVVTFKKDSTRQSFTIPSQRIEDLLGAAPQEPPTVLLDGRLQGITLPEIWRFFPEKPAPRSLRVPSWRCAGSPTASASIGSLTHPAGRPAFSYHLCSL